MQYVAKIAVATWFLAGCAFHARTTLNRPPTPAEMSQLWDGSADLKTRNLYLGPGGDALRPQSESFTFLKKDTSGASPGFEVRDASGREWDVKLGPEAAVEVVASRLVWAAGYHQPATYFLPSWKLVGGPDAGPQPAGRFRPEGAGLENIDNWAWSKNPFVGTRQLRGLFVLMVLINNFDLKTQQNVIYRAERPPRTRYVVRDLGASLGKTRWFVPGSKGVIEDFEEERFVRTVQDGRVQFYYRGGWREPHLDDRIEVDDVVWICNRLAALDDRQWRDAFRAGGYSDAESERFIARLKEKIAEGRRLARYETTE
jgi:hypothetical protein